jgi:hypothetical protein
VHFDLIIYTSLEKAIGDVILDFLEETYCNGQPLFKQRFHSKDCDQLNSEELELKDVKMRSMSVILKSQFLRKDKVDLLTKKNVILVSANMKEVAGNIQNVVPIKSYDGTKSKNKTVMSLVNFLIANFTHIKDVRDVVT